MFHRNWPPNKTNSDIRPTTKEAIDILERILPECIALYLRKNKDYGESDDDLGIRGDFADMHRKWKKLRRSMWDGQALKDESTREVLIDMIGHCLRAIYHGDSRGWPEDNG